MLNQNDSDRIQKIQKQIKESGQLHFDDSMWLIGKVQEKEEYPTVEPLLNFLETAPNG